MPSLFSQTDRSTGHDLPNQKLLSLLIETKYADLTQPFLSSLTEYADSAQPFLSSLLDFIHSNAAHISIVNENYINDERKLKLKSQLTAKLIRLIHDSDFEYGIDSEVDVFIRNQMKDNASATKSWLNDIFLEYYTNPLILSGILRVFSRFDYFDAYPEGPTIALAALSHSNAEVQESGIRAFEHWNNLESLHYLEKTKSPIPWLQEYIDDVIDDLRKEHNVIISKKN